MQESGIEGGRCPTCAAWYAQGATLCPVCGLPLAATADATSEAPRGAFDLAAAATPTEPLPQATAAAAFGTSLPTDQQDAGQAQPTTAGEQRRCSWCGALNEVGVSACQGCGAAFPRPEQDEALLRASEERIRLANDAIATLRQERERKGIGRLFGR